MRYLFSSVILSSLLVLTACQAPTTYGPKVTAEELAREEALQQKLVDEAAKSGGAPRPWRKRTGTTKQFARVADKIDKTGAQICQEMGLPEKGARCYYYFRLKQGDDLNAAADGENIVIYYGMMHFLQDDDEVAIVLAHELAHNMMGHIDATKTNIMAGAIVGALIDGLAASQGINTGGLAGTGAQIGQLSYSVGFEEEADYVGLYIAERAGYDITKAPGLWRRMTLENPEALFRETTHPSNARRAATLQKTIHEIKSKRRNNQALIPEFKTIEELENG